MHILELALTISCSTVALHYAFQEGVLSHVSTWKTKKEKRLEHLLSHLEEAKMVSLLKNQSIDAIEKNIKDLGEKIKRAALWKDPLWDCLVCMCSFWGALITLYLEWTVGHVLHLYPVAFLIAGGINNIIKKTVWKQNGH